MFHSHALHQQAESILRGAAPQLGEGYTFRGWNPVCAIGRLAADRMCDQRLAPFFCEVLGRLLRGKIWSEQDPFVR